MIISYVAMHVHARHNGGPDRVSAIIRGYKTIPRIRASPLFNLLTSGMQLRMFCRAFCARLGAFAFAFAICRGVLHVHGSTSPRRDTGLQRDTDIESVNVCNYTSLVRNREFIISPETSLFLRQERGRGKRDARFMRADVQYRKNSRINSIIKYGFVG